LDGTSKGVRDLAQSALARLKKARAGRASVSKSAGAALLHVGQAEGVLRAALSDPAAVVEARLPDVTQRDQLSLAWRSLSGRW
jgi:phytoene synthase